MMWSIASPPHWGSIALFDAIVVIGIAAGILVNRRLALGRALLPAFAALDIHGLVAVPVAVWKGGGTLISGTDAPVEAPGAA